MNNEVTTAERKKRRLRETLAAVFPGALTGAVHRISILVCLLLLAAAVCPASPDDLQPASGPSVEYQVKAAFLYNFARFVEWPASTTSSGTLTIGVLGDDPFQGALEQAIEGKVLSGRTLTVTHFKGVKDLRETQILFVSRSVEADLEEVLARVRGWHVLTAGETEGFASRGGVIGFYKEANKVRFEINLHAARTSGLQISSKLMSVARVVDVPGGER